MYWFYFTECLQLLIVLILLSKHISSTDADMDHELDILQPYLYHHGPRHHHRVVRDCQPEAFGNDTYEEVPAHHSSPLAAQSSVVECRDFVYKTYNNYWMETYVPGHHIIVSDPEKTVSILEPLRPGGCQDEIVATVIDTAKQADCIVAINAGFFNTTSGSCYGNVISDARMANFVGAVQNAHFGVETDGSLFFGYLPPDVDLEQSFIQLVAGVIWLVRDGKNYVDVSKESECSDTEETGNLQTFIDVESARVAVGHDKHGRLVIVVVDGHSWERGLNLHQFADLLIELGVINAINLDGGGSATVIINGTLANYPGDRCNISNFMYSCEREVSTVLCIHDIRCVPSDCNNHGDCFHGNCQCHDYWSGPSCDILSCGATNCSGNGECTERGCLCLPGYTGDDCSIVCPLGYYGDQCRLQCNCSHGELCDPETGRCICDAGFMGFQCETTCPYGYYGFDCKGVCDCLDGCSCHPVTGHCHMPPSLPTVWQFGHCVADKVIVSREKIVIDPDEYYWFMSCLTAVTIIAIGSIILNVLLISYKNFHSESDSSSESRSSSPRCTQSPTLPESSSQENISAESHDDADIDSSSDSQSRSFLSKIGLNRKKNKEQRALWRTWRRKFRRKRSGFHTLASDLTKPKSDNTHNGEKAPPVTHPRSPATDDLDKGHKHPAFFSPEKQRKISEHTDDLLEEIALELSSPEHSQLTQQDQDGFLTFPGSSVQIDNAFYKESMF